MNKLKLLRQLYELNKDGCVAYGKVGFDKYFAISGKSCTKDFESNNTAQMVSKILGDASFVGIEHSFSYVQLDLDVGRYPKKYHDFFWALENHKKAGIRINYASKPIPYKEGSYAPIYNEFWTCAEKKLYGFNENMANVCVTKRPCYYCLPVVKVCYYLHENSIERIVATDNGNPIKHFKQ